MTTTPKTKRPRRLTPRVTITFACDPEFFERIEDFAIAADVSRSLAIRQLITAGLASPPAAAGDQVPGQMEMAS